MALGVTGRSQLIVGRHLGEVVGDPGVSGVVRAKRFSLGAWLLGKVHRTAPDAP